MTALYDDLKIDKPRSVHEQIQSHVRALIVSGKLSPGERLPSDQQLAEHWGTHKPTVHLALTGLVREGLLRRASRVGTFVRQREAKLTCVGVYRSAESVVRSLFTESMQAALHEELVRRGIRMEVWFDTRPGDNRPAPLPALERAIAQGEIQALISVGGIPYNYPWLGKLPVPVAWIGGDDPSAVDFDHREFFKLGLRALAAQGCRSVGMICGWSPAFVSFYGAFTDLSQDLGLAVKNPWVPSSREDGHISHERYGYEQFKLLWQRADRPEGLIVYPDSIARGVVTALLEQRVAVPKQLKLVLHKNEAIELLCPLPATIVSSSEREVARALITQVQKQFRGESCAPIPIGFTVASASGK